MNCFCTLTGNVHHKVRRILLPENRIQSLEKGAFSGLEQVEKISLSGNNLKVIPEMSFVNLPSVQSIFLDGNKIKQIQAGAFCNLSSLTNVFLHRNRLNNFSMEIFSFGNLKDDSPPSNLYVNVSYNEITSLDLSEPARDRDESDSEAGAGIRILDLSHNKVSRIEPFPSSICGNLLSLHLTFNSLASFSLNSISNCSQPRTSHLRQQHYFMLGKQQNPGIKVVSKGGGEGERGRQWSSGSAVASNSKFVSQPPDGLSNDQEHIPCSVTFPCSPGFEL